MSNTELGVALKALSDASRLQIVNFLYRTNEMAGLQQIAKELNLSSATVSQHVHKLVEAGFVEVIVYEGVRFYRLYVEWFSAVSGVLKTTYRA